VVSSLDVVAYLTTDGTAPWIIGGVVVGLVALVVRARSPGSRGGLMALALIAFVFAAAALLLLGASSACHGAGGCMH
jgi:hypothetical protein